MSADAVEKRWSSLRDMFNREHKKQKLSPSGSGYNPTKEWELYKMMLFLAPYIAHRRTKTSLSLSCPIRSELERNNLNTSNNSSITVENTIEPTMIELDNEESVTASYAQYEPDTQIETPNQPLLFKPTQKVMPELDNFAKWRRNNDQLIDRQLAEASLAISNAVNTVLTLISNKKENKDGYMHVIEEDFKHIPDEHKMQCMNYRNTSNYTKV